MRVEHTLSVTAKCPADNKPDGGSVRGLAGILWTTASLAVELRRGGVYPSRRPGFLRTRPMPRLIYPGTLRCLAAIMALDQAGQPVTYRRVARRLGVNVGAVQEQVQRLEDHGLIQRGERVGGIGSKAHHYRTGQLRPCVRWEPAEASA